MAPPALRRLPAEVDLPRVSPLVRRTGRALGRVSFWAALLLPFVFFGWMLGGEVTVGNDYVQHPVAGAQSLRFFTDVGIEPMWYPHQSGGYPIGGVFFGQYFHFPAWLGARLPGFWTGDALRWISLRHLLLLALLHSAFYAALRRLTGLERTEAFLLAGVCTYNLRSLDLLRYAIGLEAAVYGQLAVLLAALHVRRPGPLMLAGVAAATQLLLTCGYPVVVPFLLLGALVLLAALVPVVGGVAVLRRGAQAAGAASVGALLAAPGLVALVEWMSVNEARVARPSLKWAAAWSLEPAGILPNLAFPWQAEVHSAFGGSTLLAAWLVVTAAALVPRARRSWPILLGLAFPLVYALGTGTPLFAFLFAHVPGFASLRVPGRALVMLPLALVASTVWLRSRSPGWRLLGGFPARLAIVAGTAFAAAGLASLVVGAEPPGYSPATLSGFWTTAHRVLWLGLGALATLALSRADRSRAAAAVLLGATTLQTGLLMRHGTWTAPSPATPSREDFHAVSHLPFYGKEPLVAGNELQRRDAGAATVAYARFLKAGSPRANCVLPVHAHQREEGVVLPFYLSDASVCVSGPEEALDRLRAAGGCLHDRLTRVYVVAADCSDGEDATAAGLAALNERNRIVALTPNLATIAVDASRPAFLVTPYVDETPNWTAVVDGAPAPLESVDGSFLGVRVPPGRHTVSLRYFSPRLVAAYRVAAATALALALGLVLVAARGRRAAAALLAAALVAGAVPAYLAWERGFVARARREVVLNHHYPELLREQRARWLSADRSSTPHP